MTDDNQRSILTRPGIIRKCTINPGSLWVVVTPTTWRWMESTHVATCTTLSDDPSTVVGLLPPDELDSVVWCERYALPLACINNAKEYEPVWDSASAAWVSRHIESGFLYDMDGNRVVSVAKNESTQALLVQPQPILSKSSGLVMRLLKKWW